MENTSVLIDQDDDEIEIDILQILRVLKKKLWLILLIGILAGGGAGAYSKYVIIPQYQSTAMVYVLSKETTLASLADLQIGSQLTKDFKIIITSRPVLTEVINKLGLNLSYEGLVDKITIVNPKDTRILSITAQDPSPQMAKNIADSVATTASEYIGDIMEMVPPKIIEEGVVPARKSSPSNAKNAVMGAAAGMILVCAIVTLQVVLNDTIQSEEDIEKYLNLTVLASVPLREKGIKENKNAATMSRTSAKTSVDSSTQKHSRRKGGKL